MTDTPPAPSWTERVHAGWYELAYVVCWAGFKLGFSLRTEGRQHVPLHGPALLVANHQSFLDPPLVGVAAHRQLCYLARKSLFSRRAFAWLIRSFNAVPIDQKGIGIEGLRIILQQLQAGQAVLVFPEGERTRDGQVHTLQPGVQLLIKRARTPVVPVGIAGAYAAWPRKRSYPLPSPLGWPATDRTIAVSVGPALAPDRLAELPRQQLLAELEAAIRSCAERAQVLRRKRRP